MDIELIPLRTLAELTMLQSWFQDEELSVRLSFPTLDWFSFVTTVPNQYARIAFEEDLPVGYVQWGVDPDGTAAIAVAVRPDIRGQGYGKRILHALLELPELAEVSSVWGGIDPDNTASLRCCTAVGFVIEPYPEEPSMVKAVYHRAGVEQRS